MRSLPIQCGTVRISSVGGERRDIRVSGFSRARLLWLFRNFYILNFAALNSKQQRLIAGMWNSGSGAGCKKVVATNVPAAEAGLKDSALKVVDPDVDDTVHAAVDLASLDLIGTVEWYLPQLYPPPAPAPVRVGDPINSPVVTHPYRLRLIVPGGVRTGAIWSTVAAAAVLLLGGAIALGPSTLGKGAAGSKTLSATAPGPDSRSAPPSRLAPAAVAEAVRTTPAAPALPPTEPSPYVIAKAPAPAAAFTHPRLHLPDAMAVNASAPEWTPPHPRPVLHTNQSATPPPCAASPAISSANQVVMIRVSVDSDGHAQDFQILQGDRNRISAALSAARRFAFEPCDGASDCDHLLKVTDYGDTSIVQRID